MFKVKICGIKRVEDANLAIEAGADALGFLVGQTHTSADFISPLTAKTIAASLPPGATPVLVTHLTDPDDVLNLAALVGMNTVQLHGEIWPEDVARLRRAAPNLTFLKAFHVTDEASLGYGDEFVGLVDGFVLDTVNSRTGQIGGTGQTHDWRLSRRIVERHPSIPVILAGGLHPENVAEAIAAVGAFGVDVNSGTKGPDGFKAEGKVRAFVTNARQAFAKQAERRG